MFKCDKCKKTSNLCEKETKKVVVRRFKTYINKEKETEGWEIDKEIRVCNKCVIKE